MTHVDTATAPSLTTLLAQHRKIAIAGGPRCGKTTLLKSARAIEAESVSPLPSSPRHFFSTDDLIGQPWPAIPHLVIGELAAHSSYLVEGVMVARALRRGLKPDVVVWLNRAYEPLSKGQRSMAKAVATVFREWVGVGVRGVAVVRNVNSLREAT